MTPEKEEPRTLDAAWPNRFSECFFGELRLRMILGSVSSETVRDLFESLFPGGATDLESLPSEIRGEVSSILKVYPEVAHALALDGTPGVTSVLRTIARLFRMGEQNENRDGVPAVGSAPPSDAEGVEWAMGEDQVTFQAAMGELLDVSGESRLRADVAPWFRLRVRFDVSGKRLTFSASGLEYEVEVLLDGCRLVTLGPVKSRRTMALGRFLILARDLNWDRVRLEARSI